MEKVKAFQNINKIEKDGENCTLRVKILEISAEVSASLDEDIEIVEVYDYDKDSFSDVMEIPL